MSDGLPDTDTLTPTFWLVPYLLSHGSFTACPPTRYFVLCVCGADVDLYGAVR